MKLWPKLFIVFISVMLVGSSIVYANITIKTPSGTTVGYDSGCTYIKNSNGKLWTVTEANLQAAIWDLSNDSGWVQLNSDLELTNTITVCTNCILNLNNYEITATTDIDLFVLEKNAQICNGFIDLDGTTTYSKSVITIDGGQVFNVFNHITRVENVVIKDNKHNDGNAFYFLCDNAGENIYGVVIEDCNVIYFNKAVYMKSTSGDGIHANSIRGLKASYCNYTFYLEATDTIEGNYFTEYQIQAAAGHSITAIYMSGANAQFNTFDGMTYDWPGTQEQVDFNGGKYNYISDFTDQTTTSSFDDIDFSSGRNVIFNKQKCWMNFLSTGGCSTMSPNSNGALDWDFNDSRFFIDGHIRLKGRTTAPGTPTVGDIYYNSTGGHILFWNGGAWLQLDN